VHGQEFDRARLKA